SMRDSLYIFGKSSDMTFHLIFQMRSSLFFNSAQPRILNQGGATGDHALPCKASKSHPCRVRRG
ncbi:MAG: hypothetical protein ACK55Z_17900, partial [bacterium]